MSDAAKGHADKAAEALTIYFGRSTVILLALSLAMPPLIRSIDEREHALALVSWLTLDTAKKLLEHCVGYDDTRGRYPKTTGVPCRRSGSTDVFDWHLVLQGLRPLGTWPTGERWFAIQCGAFPPDDPRFTERAHSVSCERYRLGLLPEGPAIFPYEYPTTPAQLNEFRGEERMRWQLGGYPWQWRFTIEAIEGFGWNTTSGQGARRDLRDLKDDPTLDRYFRTTVFSTQDVLGLAVPSGLALASLGLILGVVSSSVLGPLLALRGSTPKPSEAHTLYATSDGPFGAVLELSLVVASAIWACAPLGLWWWQGSTPATFLGPERPVYVLSGVGYAFSSAMNTWTAWQIFRIRNRPVDEPTER